MRYFAGVRPVRRLNVRMKWAWSKKPVVQNAGLYGHDLTLEHAKKKYEEAKADYKGRLASKTL